MICMVWNCQGIASREAICILKEITRTQRPQILGILEQKIFGVKADEVCNTLGFEDWVRVETVGFSGGIWILWRDSIQASVIFTHPQFILLQVKDFNQDPWVLAVVYGSLTHGLRKHLWKALNLRNLQIEGPFLAAGDFNAVLGPNAVSDCNNFSQQRCAGFAEWIFYNGLIDLGYSGPRFTWRRGAHAASYKGARLDRALSNMDWRVRFKDASVEHLAMAHSDHAPLLIKIDSVSGRRKSNDFRFQMAWLTDKGFPYVVVKNWDKEGKFTDNIKKIPQVLRDWNRDVFGNVGKRKKRVLARLQGIQSKISRAHNPGLLKLEIKLQKEMDDILQQEELIWFQKSRED